MLRFLVSLILKTIIYMFFIQPMELNSLNYRLIYIMSTQLISYLVETKQVANIYVYMYIFAHTYIHTYTSLYNYKR